jgi:CDP-glucose 4,6-dehydratase
VLEPLSGYLTLARALVESPHTAPRAVNFGPDPGDCCAVGAVVDAFSARFGGKPGWRLDGSPQPVEAGALTLSSTLAERSLQWRPTLGLQESLSWTADWYKARANGENMVAFTERQLAEYRERRT